MDDDEATGSSHVPDGVLRPRLAMTVNPNAERLTYGSVGVLPNVGQAPRVGSKD
jgi:hypothetical protein